MGRSCHSEPVDTGDGHRTCPDCQRPICGARKTGGGRNSNTSSWCHQAPGWGTDHNGVGTCKRHGGATRNARTHAATIEAERQVATLGLPRDIDPHQALLEEVQRTAGHVAWLGQLVAQLEQDDLKQYQRKDGLLWEAPAVWVRLYQEERHHLVVAAKAAIAGGVAERQVRIAEQQATLFAQAITGILKELGVYDHPQAPDVVRRHLTLLDGGAAA